MKLHYERVWDYDVDEQKCIERLAEFAQSHKQLPAYIGSVGMFTDTKTIFAKKSVWNEKDSNLASNQAT